MLYTTTAIIKITGDKRGKINNIGIANTPSTAALTIAFALYCSGVISILAVRRSLSSSALLYSFILIILASEFAIPPSHTSTEEVFSLCFFETVLTDLEVFKYGTLKASSRIYIIPTPTRIPAITCIIKIPPLIFYTQLAL